MDSTLITIECIDEIADIQGIKPQVAADHGERHARRDRVPRKPAPAPRAAEGLDETALQRVYEERLRLSPGAERMLERLRSLGIKDPARLERLQLFHRTAEDTPFARLHPVEPPSNSKTASSPAKCRPHRRRADQGRELRELRARCGYRRDSCHRPFSGDGANDLAMMAEAGVSIAVSRQAVVRERANYCFRLFRAGWAFKSLRLG